jgi:hypothetical protein
MFTIAKKRAISTGIGLAIGGLILLGPMACEEHSGSVPSIVAAGDDSNNAEIDQRLVGRWRHTDAYVSGDFSAAIDLWFILKSDGTYEYVKGAAAAGNSDTSLVNGGQGNVTKGKWRAESKILYTSAEGSSEWQPAGRYLVDDGRFMVNKVVWQRQ